MIIVWRINHIFGDITGTQLGGEGGRPPLPYLKTEKSTLILEKKALIVSILGLNLPFKM